MAVTFDEQQDLANELVQNGCKIKPPRNRTKALVTKTLRNGREVVIKDFSRRGALIKMMYGRPSLRREVRAYGVLKGIQGIPTCFGLEGKDSMVIEYIHGRLLSRFKRGEVGPEVFDRIDEIVTRAHACGVALGDLHRSNIIITKSGEVFLFDFALAVFAHDTRRPRLLVRLFMALDSHASRHMRARYLRLPEPVPVGLFGVLYRFGRGLKAIRRGKKKH